MGRFNDDTYDYTWEDGRHVIELLCEFLDGATYELKDNGNMTFNLIIKADEILDSVFYNNIIQSPTLKNFLPDLYRIEIRKLEDKHRRELSEKQSRIGSLLQETESLQKTLDLVTEGVIQIKGVKSRKPRWKRLWS